MADLQPFRALRYAPMHDPSAILAPPYDVISPDQQSALYARNPYNVIRLEFGYSHATDDHLDNRYTRAARDFAQWRHDGVLYEDALPSLYLYQQTFTVADQTLTRTSILGRVRLEPWEANVILPHEQTLARAKSDRMSLLRACAANISPIMALYDDADAHVTTQLAGLLTREPDVLATSEDGERHSLWQISDPDVLRSLHVAFTTKQLFIADGHHRYETCLAYREEVRELHRGLKDDEAAQFTLMALVAVNDPGLVVLPTHRLISGCTDDQLAALPDSLKPYFTIEEIAVLYADTPSEAIREAAAEAGSVVLALRTKDHTWIATLTEEGRQAMQQINEPAPWQGLDVAVAQELILDRVLGIPRDQLATSERIRYVHTAVEAATAIDRGATQIAILLNPTQPSQVRDVARAGGRMPQKSTYFFPKLITGLVINPVW